MKVIEVPKTKTLVDHVTELEVRGEAMAPYSKERYISSMISTTIKLRFPERAYETEKTTVADEDFVIIRRLEDIVTEDEQAR